MSKILISTSGPQLFRAEEEMVFTHHKPIQCFGNYRMPSGEKTGRRKCPDRGCEECQVVPDEHSGCHSKGSLFLQLDTPLLPFLFSSLYREDSVIVDIVTDTRALHLP